MKKIMVIIIATPLFIRILNDNIAKKAEKELLETPLPSNTKIVDSISVAGKLTGNGNGMQYFGAILIKTDLKEKELVDYYAKYKKDEFSYLIKQQITNKIDVIEHGDYKFEKMNEKENYYIVYSWASSKNNTFLDMDLRGH